MPVWREISYVFPIKPEKLEDNIRAGGGGESQQAESGEYDQEAWTFKTWFKGFATPGEISGEDNEYIEIGKTLNTA